MYICECINSLFLDCGAIRCGCSNTRGIKYQRLNKFSEYEIDFERIAKIREKLIERFKTGTPPKCCKNCYMLREDTEGEIEKPLTKEIDRLYIGHWLHCNCGCIYCVNANHTKLRYSSEVKPSEFYRAKPFIEILCKEGYIGKKTEIHYLGGESTVLDEFEDICYLLNRYTESKVVFLTSGIRYSEAIYETLKSNERAIVCVSLDSGSREMYRKIKRIDAYEEVIENIKRYALANEKNKDAVSLKYILVNGLNDRQDEIEKFIEIAKEIGLSNVTFSLNHKNAIFEGKRVSREWYDLMESLLNRRDIEVRLPLQAHKILEKGYIF